MRVFASTKMVLGFLACLYFVTPDAGAFQEEKKSEYSGALECSKCHKTPGLAFRDSLDFVALDEYKRWLETDVHTRSLLQVLPTTNLLNHFSKRFTELQDDAELTIRTRISWSDSNQLSQTICANLKYPVADLTEKDLEKSAFARNCLTCHAGYDAHNETLDRDVKDYGVGVSCELCHGPSSNWLVGHDKPAWRTKDPLEKEKLGMINVRNPALRARQCLSCHVGNIEQNKFVTHDMYAAGHPPLPGIEVGFFSQQTSRHWRTLEEKRDFVNPELRAEFVKQNGWSDGDFSESKTAVMGGLMQLRESTNLLADYISKEDAEWPEFAFFDCASCHHDLRSDTWREDRGFRGRPGRPPLHLWPNTLAPIGIVGVATNQGLEPDGCKESMKSFRELADAIQTVLNDKPFGLSTCLADAKEGGAAQKLVAWLDDRIWEDEANHKMRLGAFDQSAAVATLYLLCGGNPDYFNPKTEVRDFNSARQLAWAIDVVSGDIERLANTEHLEAAEKFATVMQSLRDKMQLTLPGPSIYVTRDGQPQRANQFRYIKSVGTVVHFERLSDRSPQEFAVEKLTAPQRSALEGGFGEITKQQPALLEAMYKFNREDFLNDLAQLKSCLKPRDEAKVSTAPDK